MSLAQPQGTRRRDRALVAATFAASAVALALVIWIKLRVVTAVPRTAYADPKDQAAKAIDAPRAR